MSGRSSCPLSYALILCASASGTGSGRPVALPTSCLLNAFPQLPVHSNKEPPGRIGPQRPTIHAPARLWGRTRGGRKQPRTHSDRCPRNVPPPGMSSLRDGLQTPDWSLLQQLEGRQSESKLPRRFTTCVHTVCPTPGRRLPGHVSTKGENQRLRKPRPHTSGAPRHMQGGPENPLC